MQALRSIGYYRLSAYLHPFLRVPKTEHVFKEGTSFEQAMRIYTFDRHLRLLIFDQIERIEIAVRSAIVNIASRDTGNSFWMTSAETYAHADNRLALIFRPIPKKNEKNAATGSESLF